MKLKRYIGVILAAAVLLCTASLPASAASVLDPFFYDFEDCTSAKYGVIGNGAWVVPTGDSIDAAHGKSLVSNVPSANNMMNLNLTLKNNAITIFGFSVYSKGNPVATVNLRYSDESTTKKSHSLAKFAGNKAYCLEREAATQSDGWYDYVFAFDTTNQKSYGWLNGTQIVSDSRTWALDNVSRFQFYVTSAYSTTQHIAFDNMFLYYLNNNMASGDAKVEPEATSYTVNMNQKIFGTDDAKKASVKIYKADSDTPISGTGTLATTKYNDQVTVPLTETLEPGATYTVKISGVKNAYYQDMNEEFTFTVAPRYAVNVVSENSGKGSAEKVTAGELFAEGVKVRVQANAESGYKFVGWGGLDAELTARQKTENPLTLTMPGYDVELTALFEEDTSAAAAKQIPFFYDMENVAVGSTVNEHGYVNGMKAQWGDKIVTGEMAKGSGNEKNHGRSMILQKGAYINFGPELKQNVVMGFSAYVDENSYFICNSIAKNDGTDGKTTTTIGDMLKVQYGNLILKGSTDKKSVPTGWNDFCVAFDYGTHTVTLWMNGEKCYTWTDDRDAKFTKTQYFNLNNRELDKCTEIALDDFYIYYAKDAVPKGVAESGKVEPDAKEYVVDMGGRIFAEKAASAAIIKDIDGNVVSGDCTIQTDGYKNLISISLDSDLEPAETYTVSFSGVQNAMGNAVTDEITFRTRDTNPKVSIACEETNMVQAGTTVSLKLSTDNLETNDRIEVYCNGKRVQTLKPSDKTFDITLASGENKIYAKSRDKGTTSEEIVLKAFEYQSGSTFCDVDFEDTDDPTEGIGGADSNGSREVIDVGGEHKHVLKLSMPKGAASSPYVWAAASADKNGIVTYEADHYFVTKVNFNLFPVHNGAKYVIPFSVNQCVLKAFGEEVMTFETNKWYHIKVMYDTVNDTASLYVNGEAKVFEKKNTLEDKWAQIVRCNIGFHSGAANDYTMYIDNLKTGILKKPYTFDISETVPYENGSVVLTFSEPMKEDALTGIAVTDANGTAITPLSSAYDSDTRTYTMAMETLLPNTKYTVTVPDSVKTTLGMGGIGTTATFMTEKTPFAINAVHTRDTASGRDVTVWLQNTTSDTKAQVVICLYKGNKLVGAKLADVDTTKSLRVKKYFDGDCSECTIEVYLIEALPQIPFAKTDILRCIDFYAE